MGIHIAILAISFALALCIEARIVQDDTIGVNFEANNKRLFNKRENSQFDDKELDELFGTEFFQRGEDRVEKSSFFADISHFAESEVKLLQNTSSSIEAKASLISDSNSTGGNSTSQVKADDGKSSDAENIISSIEDS